MHALLAKAVFSVDSRTLLSIATIYLSGPMTGLPRFNFDAFDAAAIALRCLNVNVLSPHEKDLEAGFDPDSHGEDFDLRAALAWDVEAVMRADAVVVLPGWEDSPGCAIEVTVAEALGKPVLRLADLLARGGTDEANGFLMMTVA